MGAWGYGIFDNDTSSEFQHVIDALVGFETRHDSAVGPRARGGLRRRVGELCAQGYLDARGCGVPSALNMAEKTKLHSKLARLILDCHDTDDGYTAANGSVLVAYVLEHRIPVTRVQKSNLIDLVKGGMSDAELATWCDDEARKHVLDKLITRLRRKRCTIVRVRATPASPGGQRRTRRDGGRSQNRANRTNSVPNSCDRLDFLCDTAAGGKVWSVERITSTKAVVTWGRRGGTKQTKEHYDHSSALTRTLDKLIAKKIEKGYVRL